MAREMQACPKCGEEDINVASMGGSGWVVRCPECGLQATGATREEAINKWNALKRSDNADKEEQPM